MRMNIHHVENNNLELSGKIAILQINTLNSGNRGQSKFGVFVYETKIEFINGTVSFQIKNPNQTETNFKIVNILFSNENVKSIRTLPFRGKL